ncbi:MAG: hypothetical protein RI911_141, partial [Candidatus Parcubacteria bacterium]
MQEQTRIFIDSLLAHIRPRLAWGTQTYDKHQLRQDMIAGSTVAAIIIPNAIGYAILAGLPPVMGLYAAMPALLFGALWGSSSHTITAPV